LSGKLAGKVALITGASRGLGKAMALALAGEGAAIALVARDREALEKTAEEVWRTGSGAQVFQADVTSEVQVLRLEKEVAEACGRVQILVNNAGIHDDAAFPGMSANQWHRVIDVSVNGFYNVTQALILPMIRTRWGRIVNISSVAALIGSRGQVNYAAAKGALNAATKALSLEVASRGITVNSVAPGIIASGMGGSAFDAAAIANLVPMKRAGSAEEVAGLVAYLASPEAGYITGQIISINGGMI
jgi:3-oxoacyl-[acyl-carrier protein] reductase